MVYKFNTRCKNKKLPDTKDIVFSAQMEHLGLIFRHNGMIILAF